VSPLFHPSLFLGSDVLSRYGSSANLVLSTGHGVNGYTLDASLGEFILTHPDVHFLK
jgi:fructose-1,6-bisphosphatase I